MKRAAQAFVVLLVGIFFVLIVKPAFAQQYAPNPYVIPQTNPDVPKNLHTGAQVILLEVLSAVSCQLAGVDPLQKNQQCLGVDPKTGNIGFVENGGGAIGLMSNMIGMLYTAPLHTNDYLADLGNNFGIAKKTYAEAEGGMKQLSPLLGAWKVTRNISYLLFVLVFVLIGLLIMLRIKIDPRTVMTIQNQIPKLIIGIVLITFSFAIAGLLIDMMYVVIYLVIGIIAQADPAFGSHVTTVNQNLYQPPIGFVNEVFSTGNTSQGGGGVFNITRFGSAGLYSILTRMLTAQDVTQISHGAIQTAKDCGGGGPFGCLFAQLGVGTGFIGAVMSNAFGWLIGFTVSMLAFFIIIIALLFALFRVWFMLIKAYVFFLLDVIAAPFWIIAGMFPGGGGSLGFGGWIRDVLANLAVFPATIAVFFLGRMLMDNFGYGDKVSGNPSGGFVPPLIGNPNSINNLGGLIGIGVILMAPKMLEILRDVFKAPQFKYLTGIGEALGAGQATLGAAAGFGWSTLTRPASFTHGAGLLRRAAIRGAGRIPKVGPKARSAVQGMLGKEDLNAPGH